MAFSYYNSLIYSGLTHSLEHSLTLYLVLVNILLELILQIPYYQTYEVWIQVSFNFLFKLGLGFSRILQSYCYTSVISDNTVTVIVTQSYSHIEHSGRFEKQ